MDNQKKHFENEELQEQQDVNDEKECENLEDEEITSEGKNGFEQVEELKAKLKEQVEKSEQYYNSLQRSVAEFDNFRKRTAKEKERIYGDAVGDAIGELLPVIDNLERAIQACTEGSDAVKLLEGVDMVLKQFKECLAKLGVEEIKAVGEQFDPEVHNAVMHVEDETVGQNIIIEEFQKGYKMAEKVIRHSMVKVAN